MGKSTKAFKKFASSGKLKDTIQKRRQHQQAKRKSDDRKTHRSKQRGAAHDSDDEIEDEGSEGEDEEDEKEAKRIGKPNAGGKAGGVAKTVEELFGAGGLDVEGGEESELEELGSDDEDEVDDEEDEGEEDLLDEEAMKKAMKDLAKNDPEFFKYLKENDEDLLDFGQSSKASKGKGKQDEDEEDDDDEDEEMESDEEGLGEDEEQGEAERKRITVTLKMLRQWQEGMLRVSSSAIYVWRNLTISFILYHSNTPLDHFAKH